MNKAFLKWAGGKFQSLKLISETSGYIKGRFIEPFVGSGIVSLNVPAPNYILNDLNKDLINVYKMLKENEFFILEAKKYFIKENNDLKKFNELRHKFNVTTSLEEKAYLFIYLNRHCFNGLCRYNKSGEFNVPFGKYNDVYFPQKELKFFKNKLNECELYCKSFEEVMLLAVKEDVIYADPPYVPLSTTASFTDYNATGFTVEQQILLTECAEKAPCRVLISNHDTEFTRELYKNANKIFRKKVSRTISAVADSRKPIYELLAIYDKEE